MSTYEGDGEEEEEVRCGWCRVASPRSDGGRFVHPNQPLEIAGTPMPRPTRTTDGGPHMV